VIKRRDRRKDPNTGRRRTNNTHRRALTRNARRIIRLAFATHSVHDSDPANERRLDPERRWVERMGKRSTAHGPHHRFRTIRLALLEEGSASSRLPDGEPEPRTSLLRGAGGVPSATRTRLHADGQARLDQRWWPNTPPPPERHQLTGYLSGSAGTVGQTKPQGPFIYATERPNKRPSSAPPTPYHSTPATPGLDRLSFATRVAVPPKRVDRIG